MTENVPEDAAADEAQLDARLAELLHLMHRQHLSLQEAQPVSSLPSHRPGAPVRYSPLFWPAISSAAM